jgi:hypothetical protein
MNAKAERPAEHLSFDVMIHSAERQLGRMVLEVGEKEAEGDAMTVSASVAGHLLDIELKDSQGNAHSGTLSIPEETIFMGPSPIWLVHLMLTAPIPEDRMVTAPYVALGLHGDDIEGGFYRFARAGNIVSIAVLDADGNEMIPADIGNGIPGLEVILADDGCPEIIRAGRYVTEVVRVPDGL